MKYLTVRCEILTRSQGLFENQIDTRRETSAVTRSLLALEYGDQKYIVRFYVTMNKVTRSLLALEYGDRKIRESLRASRWLQGRSLP